MFILKVELKKNDKKKQLSLDEFRLSQLKRRSQKQKTLFNRTQCYYIYKYTDFKNQIPILSSSFTFLEFS